MAAQLPADRRRGAAQSTGDLADADPSSAQGGDPLPFQQADIPAGAGRLGQPGRRQPTVLRSPPIAVLRPMPSSLQVATVPTPDCRSFQYSDLRSSCRLRPRRPTRTPLAHQDCCDKPWNPPLQLVACRYERGSIILTSNEAFSEWGAITGNEILATAIFDRLLHHCDVLSINGPSYLHDALQRAHRARAADPDLQATYRRHRPMVERSIAWITRGPRRVSYRRVMKNDAWLHL
jgi:IstB-like ATP binding protein